MGNAYVCTMQRYSIVEKVGEGTYGVVYLCSDNGAGTSSTSRTSGAKTSALVEDNGTVHTSKTVKDTSAASYELESRDEDERSPHNKSSRQKYVAVKVFKSQEVRVKHRQCTASFPAYRMRLGETYPCRFRLAGVVDLTVACYSAHNVAGVLVRLTLLDCQTQYEKA